MKWVIQIFILCIALLLSQFASAACNVPICTEQGGARQTIGSGGSLDVESGGELDVESGGSLKIGGTAVTSTAAELNALDGITSTVTEMNILDGVTATAAELNYLDITTLGTGAASKAVVLDTGDDYTWPAAGILTYGVLKDSAATTITSTGTEINLLDGSVVGNSVASKAAMVDAAKQLQTNANNGTMETGVTAVHYGDGVNVTAVLTLTNVVVTVGSSENLGVGALIYTLPTGAALIRDAYMSVAIAGVTTTTDTPDVGLGTVIASGVVTALGGTATFEDIITGQAAADTNGTATVKGAGPTAGVPLEITTAGAHTVHVNAADGWGANADAAGTLNGTVVISYIRQDD